MIRWMRIAPIAGGKLREATQWAKETREYTKTKFEGGADVKIFVEMLGDYGIMCWMVDFTNLAALELAGQVLDADAGYQDRLQAANELFLSGIVDKVYQSID